MGSFSNNHNFYIPDPGETGWGDEKSTDWSDLDTRLVIKDTEANRPAAGTEGRWFLATDTYALYYDNGTTWDDVISDTSRVNSIESGNATITGNWQFDTDLTISDGTAIGFGNSDDFTATYDSASDRLEFWYDQGGTSEQASMILNPSGTVNFFNNLKTESEAVANRGYLLRSGVTDSERFGLKYGSEGSVGDTDDIMLTNREAGGATHIAANAGTAGDEAVGMTVPSGATPAPDFPNGATFHNSPSVQEPNPSFTYKDDSGTDVHATNVDDTNDTVSYWLRGMGDMLTLDGTDGHVDVEGDRATNTQLAPNAHIPMTELADGEHVELRFKVASTSQSLYLWRWGCVDENGDTPTGLSVEYWDGLNNINHSSGTNDSSGDPLYVRTSGDQYRLVLYNGTGSTINASAFFSYTIE